MTEIAALGLRVDGAEGVERSASALDRLTKSADSAEKAADRLNKESGKSKKALDDVAKSGETASGSVSSLAAAASRAGAIIGAAFSVTAIVRYADAWSDMTSLVRVNIGAQEDAADVMSRLSDIARMTYSSMEATARSFATNAFTLNALGKSTQQQLDYTEALNNALVVSGAKGQQFEMVQNSLNRAMAEGSLRGTELQNVLNYGSRVAGLLAEELGVNVTELRALAAQGKITGEVIYDALTKNMETVREEAESMPATIGDAFTLIRNAVLQTVGVFDQQNAISETLATTLISVADNMSAVFKIIASATAGWVAYRLAVMATTANLNLATIAQRAFNVAAAANPYVLGATAIVTAATAAWTFRDAIHSWIDPVGAAEKKLRDLKKAQDELTESSEGAEIKALTSLISAYEKEMDDLAKTISILMPLEDTLQKQRLKQMDDEFMRLAGLHQLHTNLLSIRKAGQREVSESTKESERLNKSIEDTIKKLKEEILVLEKGERALIAFKNENDETVLALYDQVQALKASAKAKEEYTSKLKTLMDNLYPAKARVRELTEEWRLLNQAVASGDADRSALHYWLDAEVAIKNTHRAVKKLADEADPFEEIWKNTTQRVQGWFADAFYDILDKGKITFDGLLDMFKRMAAEMMSTRIMIGIGGTIGFSGGAMAGTAGGGTGMLGGLLNAGSWISAGKNLWQGFAGLATGQGLSGFAGLFGGHAANAALIPQHMLTRAASQQAAALSNFANTVGPILAGIGGAIQGWQSGNRMNAVTGALGGWGGAKAGAAAGSYFLPGIGTAIGAVLGGILGSSLGSSVFGGSWENRRSGIELGFDDEGLLLQDWIRQTKKGGWFGSTKRRYIYSEMEEALAEEFRTGYDAMIDVLGTQFMAIGADLDRAVFEGVRIGAASINTSDQTEEEVQAQIEKWFSDLQQAMIKGALNAAGDPSAAVKLLRATGGDAAMLEALGGLMGVAGINAVQQARDAQTQLTMVESYRAVTEATRTLISEYDGSLEATLGLTEAMAVQQEMAYGLATAYLQASDAVGALFGNLSESIRTSLMSAEELYEYQRGQVHSLTDLLGTLTDPEAILRTSQEIERLVSGMWGRLDETQRALLGDEFLDYVDRTQALAQDRLAQGLAELESTQSDIYSALTSQMNDVADRMIETADRMQEAANLQWQSALQFGAYVSQMGGIMSNIGQGQEQNA